MANEIEVNKENFWNDLYLKNTTPWDIGQPSPAFVSYFKKFKKELKKESDLNIAVLGSGNGHDAFYLANEGFNVVGFDFAEDAIKSSNEKKEKEKTSNIKFIKANFFDLVKDKSWKSSFDCVIEHTSFCAISPNRRKEYVELIGYLLKPKGKLIGMFFFRPIESGGPPFGTNELELKEFFNCFNEIIAPKKGSCLHSFTGIEYFAVYEKPHIVETLRAMSKE